MGSSGEKRTRRGTRRSHLPKVGTATEEKYELRAEREAVEENLGVGPGSPAIWKWTIAVVAVVFVVAAIVALIAIN